MGVGVSATWGLTFLRRCRNVNPQVAEMSTQGHYFGIVFFKFLATGFESAWTAYTIQISSRSFIIWNQVAFLVNHPFKTYLDLEEAQSSILKMSGAKWLGSSRFQIWKAYSSYFYVYTEPCANPVALPAPDSQWHVNRVTLKRCCLLLRHQFDFSFQRVLIACIIYITAPLFYSL